MAAASRLVLHGLLFLLGLVATPLVALGVAVAVILNAAEEFLRSRELRKYQR